MVSYSQINDNSHTFTIDLGNQQTLKLTTFKDWVNVAMSGATKKDFGDSVGLMGAFEDGAMISRNGSTVIEDPHAFGLEWLVTEKAALLFQAEQVVEVQTAGCTMPDPRKTVGRRHLGEALSEEDILEACQHFHNSIQKKLCEYDVRMTGDLDVAHAGGF